MGNNSNSTYPVLFNACYGGYSYSDEALKIIDSNPEIYNTYHDRANPVLIKLFYEKGSEWMSGDYSRLDIENIPVEYGYEITEYDGYESVELTPRVSKIEELVKKGNVAEMLRYLSRTVVLENDVDYDW